MHAEGRYVDCNGFVNIHDITGAVRDLGEGSAQPWVVLAGCALPYSITSGTHPGSCTWPQPPWYEGMSGYHPLSSYSTSTRASAPAVLVATASPSESVAPKSSL